MIPPKTEGTSSLASSGPRRQRNAPGSAGAPASDARAKGRLLEGGRLKCVMRSVSSQEVTGVGRVLEIPALK